MQIVFFQSHWLIKESIEKNRKNLTMSDSWILTFPIHIDNNWTTTNSSYGWCNGAGTPGDPYVIENVTIDAQNSGSCIFIENTIEHFIIQNCTLINSEASPNAAIRLYSVSNGRIISNNITNNDGRGISLFSSSNNLIEDNLVLNNGYGITLSYSNNNKILKNFIKDNDMYGIYLWASDNNLLLENIVNHNGYLAGGYHGIYITQSSSPVYDSLNNTIKENHIQENRKSGIFINSCDNNTIFSNTIENNLDDGITIQDSDSMKIIGNRIQNNIGDCISVQTSLNLKDEWNVCNYFIDPFIIDELGNGNFTWEEISQFAWVTGNGSSQYPYRIYGVIVNAQSVGSCIRIENSNTKYFIIEGCLVMNAQASGGEAGIKLDEVQNGTIYNCEIIDNYAGIILDNSEYITLSQNSVDNNLGQGIILRQSKFNHIIDNSQSESRYYGLFIDSGSNNNTIRGNVFEENTGAATHGDGIRILFSESNIITNNTLIYNDKGIRIQDGSKHNQIYNNTIKFNTNFGALVIPDPRNSTNNVFYLNKFNNTGYNAYDNGTNTKWDNGIIGNWWSDYIGLDADDNGVGDTPYFVAGSAGTMDNFPIWDDGSDSPPPNGISFGFFFLIIATLSLISLSITLKNKLRNSV